MNELHPDEEPALDQDQLDLERLMGEGGLDDPEVMRSQRLHVPQGALPAPEYIQASNGTLTSAEAA